MINERKAFLIVDMQNDFCRGGALPVPGADELIPVINCYTHLFHEYGYTIFASRDWHQPTARHFKRQGGAWPQHCIQNTYGAAFHPQLLLPEETCIISKGTADNADGYSIFEGRDQYGGLFSEILVGRAIETVFVCGVATDYCVKQSVLALLFFGCSVCVLADAIKGWSPEKETAALNTMKELGAFIMAKEEVLHEIEVA